MGGERDSQKRNDLPDGVSTYPADEHDLQSYVDGRAQLGQLQAPVLVSESQPNRYLYVAAFDGTGNSIFKDDPANHTNVADIAKQIQSSGHPRVAVGYVEGPGTQNNVVTGALDGAFGYTYEDRLEQMYAQFITQAKVWRQENPDAEISVADVGFSRGAVQAAGFARLVHERGIQDPDGQRMVRGEDGRLHVEYTLPPLVPPGQVAQAVGMFDPVATGTPENFDRRLPPSVITGFQVTAEDERRNLFKGNQIIDPGMSPDGRFLNVIVGGAHSDIGGSYELNGLAVRSGNLMVDYVNSLSDTPILSKRPEPMDPAMNVVHRSEEHKWFYRTSEYDQADVRQQDERLTSRGQCRVVDDCNNNEAMDGGIAARFDQRAVPISPTPLEQPVGMESPPPWRMDHAGHPGNVMYQQALAGVHQLDDANGRGHDIFSVQMAGSLAARSREEGFNRVDSVLLSDDRNLAFAVQGDLDGPLSRFVRMPTMDAVNQPLVQSSDDWSRADRAKQQDGQQQAEQQTQTHSQGGMVR